MSEQFTTLANQESSSVPLTEFEQIGPYRVLSLIGRGGMGAVYLAESDKPKRQVAIKLMLGDRFDTEGLARFQREMEVLARLEHPGIARLYESGSLDDRGSARPWFAMEFVDGLPLDSYVQEHRLSTRRILELMTRVARAMHYAHQRGVIHRDIKPANILVDASGQPKILDFGIARLSEGEQAGVRTRFGQIIGTLAYMSPEQLSGASNAEVRSDVYAMGVVLYQLLSGELPIAIGTTSLLDAIQILANGRRTPLSERNPKYRGDLELIVETACRRDREQRYDSAASFASDLEAYLQKRPLSARRPTWHYLFGKFLRRNPVLVGTLAVTALCLAGATVWSWRAAERAQLAEALARSAEAEASARADEANAVIDFLTDAIREAAPDRARGRDLRLREVLDTLAEQRIPAAQSNVEFKLRQTLFESHLALAAYDDADADLKRMRTLCAPGSALPHCFLLDASEARLRGLSGQVDLASELHEQALARARTTLPAEDPLLDQMEIEYADVLNQLGRNEQAAAVLRGIMTRMAGRSRVDPRLRLQVEVTLADALSEFGRLHEAEQVMVAAIPPAEQALGVDHPSVLLARNSALTLVVERERFVEAGVGFQQLYDDAVHLLGPEHRITMTILGNLGTVQIYNQQLDAAELSLSRRDEVFRQRYPHDWRSRLNNLVSLSAVLNKRNQYEQGLARLDRALAEIPAGVSFSPEQANAINWRGSFLMKLGRRDQAEREYRQLVERFALVFGEGDVQLARYRMRLAGALIARGEREEAGRLLAQSLPQLVQVFGEQHSAVVEARGYQKQWAALP